MDRVSEVQKALLSQLLKQGWVPTGAPILKVSPDPLNTLVMSRITLNEGPAIDAYGWVSYNKH